MTSIHQNRASEIVERARISEVWTALGGDPPRRGRAQAFWRQHADGLNVSLNDAKGAWFDFRDNIGGGILDLIRHVKGCDRKAALQWLANHLGIPLENRSFTESERREWDRRRAAAEAEARDLLAWRDRLLSALQNYRDEVFHAYHRALRYIVNHGLDAPLGELAADVAELYEDRYQELDGKLDLLRTARFRVLLPHFRNSCQRRAAA
ncbi:MAG: hypothetical protein AAB654_13075 [Acidobacteriota bacterium]